MKRALLPTIVAATLALTSCQTPQQTDLEKLEARRSELKTKLTVVNDSIAAIRNTMDLKVLPKVRVAIAQKQLFEHYFSVQGDLSTDRGIYIQAETAGQIKNLNMDNGNFVRKGEVLATVNADIIRSQIQELNEQIDLAKFLYDKQVKLSEQGVGTEIQLKQTKAQYNSLLKSKKTAEEQLAMTTVTAPFDGYLENVTAVKGMLVSPGMPLGQLVNLDKVAIKADVPETYLQGIAKNTPVQAIIPVLNDTINNLKIDYLGKVIDPDNRTINIKVYTPQQKGKLIPNLTAQLLIKDYVDTAAVTVPSGTILEDNAGNSFIYALENNKVKKRIVKTGKTYKGTTQILSGAKSGDKIISDGARKVSEGIEVEIIDF